MKDELLTINEVAGIVKRDSETVRCWVRSSKLKAAKVGGQWMVRQSTLDEFMGIKTESPRG